MTGDNRLEAKRNINVIEKKKYDLFENTVESDDYAPVRNARKQA